MPFRTPNDAAFLGEESFATWHEGLDHCEIRTPECFPGHAAPAQHGTQQDDQSLMLLRVSQ